MNPFAHLEKSLSASRIADVPQPFDQGGNNLKDLDAMEEPDSVLVILVVGGDPVFGLSEGIRKLFAVVPLGRVYGCG